MSDNCLDINECSLHIAASGDDNCVVGLAVDQTTSSIQLPALDGETGEKLPPGPVLLCMTIEGNLSLFSAARYLSLFSLVISILVGSHDISTPLEFQSIWI